MNILWLASWDPNQLNPYEGDFIHHALKMMKISVMDLFTIRRTEFNLFSGRILKSGIEKA